MRAENLIHGSDQHSCSSGATAPARPLIAVLTVAAGLVIAVLLQRVTRLALVLPIAGAALMAAVFVIYRAPEVHGAIRALTHTRLSLASSARSCGCRKPVLAGRILY